MIDYIEFEGKRLHIGSGAKLFPHYFNIDSMSLLLGKNGSGKTSLLLNAAEVLTTGAAFGDQGHWTGVDRDGNEFGRDTRFTPEGLGVIYYTPLPFHRPSRKHHKFIDASRISGAKLQSRMLRLYPVIAQKIGIPTRLTARLSYDRKIFSRWIVPLIMETECEVLGLADNIDVEREKYNHLVDPQSREQHVTRLASIIEEHFLSRLKSNHDETYTYAALACLEHVAQGLKDRRLVLQLILSELKLLTFPKLKMNEISQRQRIKIHKFLLFLDASNAQIEGLGETASFASDNEKGIIIEVNQASQLSAIKNGRTALQCSWENLSSGEMSLVEQFSRLAIAMERFANKQVKSVILFIDEGDAYLHLEWQRLYVEKLQEFLEQSKSYFDFECMQVVLATHSPIISGDFPSPMVQRLGDQLESGVKTFANSMDALVLDAFSTPSIGSFAATKIKALYQALKESEYTDEDQRLLEEIGDEALRNAVRFGEDDNA